MQHRRSAEKAIASPDRICHDTSGRTGGGQQLGGQHFWPRGLAIAKLGVGDLQVNLPDAGELQVGGAACVPEYWFPGSRRRSDHELRVVTIEGTADDKGRDLAGA